MHTTSTEPSETALGPVAVDQDELRSALSHFPSGIVAICANVNDEPDGMIATSFAVGVSYDPPLVSFSIQNASRTWPRLRESKRLGISVLGDSQADFCMQLASRTRDRFTGIGFRCTEQGSILLHGAALWFDCELSCEIPIGDHQLVVLEIKAIKAADGMAPLVYHASAIRTVTTLPHS